MGKQKTDVPRAARQILEQSRKKLLQAAPELLPAIYLMQAEPTETPGPLSSDGLKLYYHPETVIRSYLEDRGALCRALLHVLCHGLLGHFEKRRGQLTPIFDAAADVAAQALAMRIDGDYGLLRSWGEETVELLCAPNAGVDALYLAADTKEAAQRLIKGAKPLRSDPHERWDAASQETEGGAAAARSRAKLRRMWANAAAQTAQALARGGKGDAAGMCSELFRETEPSPISYAAFLRRFCRLREQSVPDPDSVNRIWYHVGLELLGDTPLIECDELREETRLEHIAVAIDTSGSCSDEVAQGFLRELLAVLRDGGGARMELTLIQCDAKIQKVETLSAEDCAEELLGGMELRGWGGTDFRPVFDYVSENRESEDGTKFRGLLYFTDGCGDYPEQPPDYPVAFFFPRGEDGPDDCIGFGCPDWITKVVVTPEGGLQIREAEGGTAI